MSFTNKNNFWKNVFLLRNNKISHENFEKIRAFYKIKMNYKTFYVVGTNGKGSIVSLLNQALKKMNFSVATFTSPHLMKVNERIAINNKNISLIDLKKYIKKIQKDFPNLEFGFFSLLFFSALLYFEKEKLDYVIFEAGIGAKKDIVNFVSHDYGILTSIGMDHKAILGDSKEKIAIDKSHFIKDKIELFFPANIEKKYTNIFIEKAKGFNYHIIENKTEDIYLSNEIFVEKIIKKIFDFKIKLKYKLKGRMQIIKTKKATFFLDVGHNYEAIEWVIKLLKKRNLFFENILISIGKDKEYKEIFKLLKSLEKSIYFYDIKNGKNLLFSNINEKFIKIDNLKDFIQNTEKNTLVIGSFYLISEFLASYKINK